MAKLKKKNVFSLNKYKKKSNVIFKEIEEALQIMQQLYDLDRENKMGENPLKLLAYKKLLTILEDVVGNGVDSPYVAWVSPYQVTTHNTSQVRQISIDTEHLDRVKNSIENLQAITHPVLLGEGVANALYDLFNGVHRNEGSKDLIKTGLLPESFKYPAVIIPASVVTYATPALQELQNALNEATPRKSNNGSDIQKSIETQVSRDSLDLQNEDDYAYLLNKLKILFRHHSPSSLKKSLTREKNKQAKQTSGVLMKKLPAFRDDMIKMFASEIKKTKPKVDSISMRGSVVSQLYEREMLHKHTNPSQPIWHHFVDQDQKGDSSTTITNRIAYFKRLKTYWEIRGVEGVYNDLTIINPQNTSGFQYNFNDKDYQTKAELLEIKEHWIIVTKDEMIEYWKSGGDVKPEWIFRS